MGTELLWFPCSVYLKGSLVAAQKFLLEFWLDPQQESSVLFICFVLCSVLFLLQLDNKRCLASEENRTLGLGPGALTPSCLIIKPESEDWDEQDS